MKRLFFLIKYLCFILLLFISILSAKAYNLRQYSSKNGLTNSAVLSICQDNNGLMWFGTCEGLNIFNGIDFNVYNNSQNNLSGNIIGGIVEADNNILWVQTNYGLDRFNTRNRTIHSYKEFKGNYKLIKSPGNDIFIMKEDNYLYYYEPSDQSFHSIFIDGLIYDDILEMAVDEEDNLWFISSEGEFRYYSIQHTEEKLSVTLLHKFKHEEEIISCFYNEGIFYFVDATHALYEYNVNFKNKFYIHNINEEILKYGEVSAILKYHDDYFIGFKSSGLIRLQSTPKLKNRFLVNEINIKSGIFCLMKDRFQDIVWVGTDGQGVYMYYVNQYTIKSTLFSSMDCAINNPVRALYIDKERTMWMGTKGDGIIKTSNYNVLTNEGDNTEHILSSNSALEDNSVYAFAESRKNILWIGSENGLNYYSYKDRRVRDIHFTVDGKPVKYIHAICELNDSTLWFATVGEGIVKAQLTGTADKPVITNAKRFIFDDGKISSNYFFTAYKENDSIIWFGNRGYGAYKVNNIAEEIETFTFDENDSNQTLNDIFAIVKTSKGYWFGTSYGLSHLSGDMKMVFNESNGLPNNTIHGMLHNRNNLWLSTNQGVVEFNTKHNTFRTYKQQHESEVSEFSDGASFIDPITNVLFFGGVNGYISIVENDYMQQTYNPSIQFNHLSIFGKECNFYDFIGEHQGKEVLELRHNQNFFSIAFTAIDYINGNDYTYFYKINELSENWIWNESSNNASFTNLSPGNYTLEVKYRNNITGQESKTGILNIHISPPWYNTTLARIIYSLIAIIILFIVFRISLKWYRFKKNNIIEKLNIRQKEEVYESKLRFFTNITHELCTPLTLISGPCEKIITHPGTDEYVDKYATLIKYNAEKLNGLIQELIDFRRLETGNKTVTIKKVPVSELIRNVADSFLESAERKGYSYSIRIADGIIWNSDSSCLTKIVTNLISNAFKYTFERGDISVELYTRDNDLLIIVSNTGKGIKEENLAKIFDRYTILDNFETQSKNEFSPRNGLGLAICNHMVKLLHGDIRVESVLNEVTAFTVILPQLEIDIEEQETEVIPVSDVITPEILEPYPIPNEITLPAYDKSKQTIMIVDDDSAMLWFVTQIFIGKYNVIPINDPKLVMSSLKENLPDLIISDVMMPGIDGISLLKSIKEEKLFRHIPLILLSAKNDTEEQVRGIESGAEVYVTKPFNVEYLEKIALRLLERKIELKEYYASPLSSFELNEGKLTHIEDQEFIDQLLRVIEENLSDADLSAETLSTMLKTSVRQLYRKTKDITSKTPNEIIKEQRLTVVERLLVTTTNLSVDEIMHKTGFHNRGHFFKVFSQRFGTTPKSYRELRKSDVLPL